MIRIVQATIPDHQSVVADLFAEYVRWVCPRIYQEYGAVFDAETIIVHDMETIDIFLPPKGSLLLAYDEDVPAGCVGTRTIGERIAELKRMYVRLQHRGKGIGSMLVQESIRRAKENGYSVMRLDTGLFMSNAHRVYRSFGFGERMPYPESEVPEEYWRFWIFMELNLATA